MEKEIKKFRIKYIFAHKYGIDTWEDWLNRKASSKYWSTFSSKEVENE